MRITKIEVANVAGLARADINLNTGALLVAGANMSGKSSLRDAISMAMTGQPARVSKKKDLDQMVHDGAKKGRATIYSGEEMLGQFTLPKGEFVGPDIKGAEYLPLVLDHARFASMSSDERRTTLFKVAGCSAGIKAIEPLLAKRSLNMAMFEEVKPMLRSGFPAAEKFAQDKAREAKGAWKATTGEEWGSVKADGWNVEIPSGPAISAEDIAQAQAALATTLQEIEKGVAYVARLEAQQQAHAGYAARTAQLTEAAGLLSRAEAKLANDQRDLIEWESALATGKAGLAIAQAASSGCECPSCGTLLKIVGNALELHTGANGDAKNTAALAAEVTKTSDAVAMLRRTVSNDQAAVATAHQAQKDLDAHLVAAPEAGGQAQIDKATQALLELRQLRDQQKAKAEALQERQALLASGAADTAKAAQQHADIKAWLAIAEALAPDGIPAELLAQALDPVNQSLAMLAGLASWPLVEISRDIEVTSQGRPYGLISESEKWRADTLLALAIAQLTELRLVLLDRFDVLEPKARGQLIGLVHQLIGMESIDTVIMLGTLKEKPGALPDGFTAAWISNCIVEV